MKPTLEKIAPHFRNSFYYEQYSETHINKPPQWHYHPEIELAYINKGNGKIQVGSHVSNYHDGALILVGSNVPHCGFTNNLLGDRKETIIQIKPDFMGAAFLETPEMLSIKLLFEIAKKGVVYHGKTKKILGDLIETLGTQEPFDRFITLLQVLKRLEASEEHTILNAEGYAIKAELEDNNRINIIFNYVREEFQNPIALETIAEIVSMSVPGFCRYFKKITGKTFTQFVNEYRLVHAAKLLHEKQISISEVCFESGFNNFSHFNKLFKQFTGKTASSYRNELNFTVME